MKPDPLTPTIQERQLCIPPSLNGSRKRLRAQADRITVGRPEIANQSSERTTETKEATETEFSYSSPLPSPDTKDEPLKICVHHSLSLYAEHLVGSAMSFGKR